MRAIVSSRTELAAKNASSFMLFAVCGPAARGISVATKTTLVDGDSFLIDPQTAFPAPHIRARVAGVQVTGDGIVLRLGDGAPQMKTGEKGNYIAIRGGRIEYGRDEMFDSNLTMVDSSPRDPFEFYLNDYWKQMVAASIKVTPDQGLRIRVPDYSKIGRSPGATEAAGDGAKRERSGRRGKA